jgi:hypothetical protein
MRKDSKTIHEAFARFFEMPRRETLRDLLKENLGELRNCDFKESWPDHGSLSKHLLGLGNSGGGCLVVGVRENEDKSASPIGMVQIVDKADIINGVKNFLPEDLLGAIEIADFKFESSEYPNIAGKAFQVLFVHFHPDKIPFIARRAGNSIRAAAIYIRREGSTEEASNEELQRLFKERVAATPQTYEAQSLKQHLEELNVLYSEIPRFHHSFEPLVGISSTLASLIGSTAANSKYPKEDYESFVRRLLDSKKLLIERLLGLL